ncbi:MAG: TrkA family potassium uptake protein [Alphaproteobacteria bacterium]
MHSVFFIALRRLRPPLILIIVIFAIATTGLALIPGVDADGRPWHMSLFQAFYFVSYTATTIGFGELPQTFTDGQRLWVTVVIYMSVIGWTFLLGNLLTLVQDKGFQQAIVIASFRRAVRNMREPFYIICGLGETGLILARALDRLDQRFVVLDSDEQRLQELNLQELSADCPKLAADARSPETLILAGLRKKECRGVLALSNNDEVNLGIALAVRLLHPGIRAICRSHTPEITASMATVGAYHVINPFREFGEYLALAMRAPHSYRLLSWLIGPPGTHLPPRIPAPPGYWIVCGYGRFGMQVVAAIQRGGFNVSIVDPDADVAGDSHIIRGLASDAAILHEAKIGQAAGIVAGTDNDVANLAIAVAARQLNKDIFVILRQNQIGNQSLFAAMDANMTMVSSQIIANECLAILRTRLLAEFLAIVRVRGDEWAQTVVERLQATLGEDAPDFWSFDVTAEDAPGLKDSIRTLNASFAIADLRRQIDDRDVFSKCLPLLLVRSGETIELPTEDTKIQPGDQLLFAGTDDARRHMRQLLRNANVAEYVITGRNTLGGVFWRNVFQGGAARPG